MATILIACSMLADEINQIMEQERQTYPVQWMPCGLHASPDRLRSELQSAISAVDGDYAEIVLGYCRCGNGLQGLRSERAQLSLVDYPDCVHLLLGGVSPDLRTLYFTAGWLRSDQFIGKEYQQTLKKYGPEKTQRIYAKMLKGYTALCLLDTQAYDLGEYAPTAKATATLLGLQYTEARATTQLLRQLLTGETGSRLLRVPPNTPI